MRKLMIGVVLAAVAAGVVELHFSSESSRRERARNAIRCRHCLVDGQIPSVVARTKAALRNPYSFTHRETSIRNLQVGEHRFAMTYTAQNGFGADVVGSVTGKVAHHGCGVTEFDMGD